jgi:hypothetical protein
LKDAGGIWGGKETGNTSSVMAALQDPGVDIMVILYNQKVEEERAKREARKRRKQKPKKKEYLTKRDREYIIVMAACTQGIAEHID